VTPLFFTSPFLKHYRLLPLRALAQDGVLDEGEFAGMMQGMAAAEGTTVAALCARFLCALESSDEGE
jgi:hypothetical protein